MSETPAQLPIPQAAARDDDAKARRARPRLRLRLRSVLVLVSLLILMLPLVGLYALRLHETTLLHRTQDDLTIAAAALASSYAAALASSRGGAAEPLRFATPRLGFGAQAKAALPPARPAGPARPAATAAGRQLAPVVAATAAATGAAIRLLDARGVVVATTAGDLGLSLAHVDDVATALAGTAVSSLRSASGEREWPLLRGAMVDVLLVLPIAAGRLGAVAISRQPANILDTLQAKRSLLAQGGAVFLAVALAVALLTTRTLALPIRRLALAAGRVSRGETDRFERYRHYRVHELADLADSVEAMVANLQQRAAYLRDFSHHLSHELKTPIAAARGALELLRDHQQEMAPRDAKRFVANIAADIDRLEHLTARLVALAQAEMAPQDDEAVDVLAVGRELDAIAVAPSATPVPARISRSALTAVLDNLADNARQHGATKVSASARTVGGEVELLVRDNGVGISPGNRARIFDPFFTTRQAEGGSGLGLAICRTLLRNAGGNIELAPSLDGAAFKIVLRSA